MVLVGANIPIGKAVVAVLPVFLFCLIRFGLATLLLAGQARPVARGDWLVLLVHGVSGSFLFNVAMLEGVKRTAAVDAGIITASLPAVTALLAVPLLGERPCRAALLGAVLAGAGIAAINLAGARDGAATSLAGNLMVLGAVASEAVYIITARRLSKSMAPLALAFASNLIGLVLFAPLALPQALALDWSGIAPGIWALVGFYSLTGGILCFFLWYRGMARVPAAQAGLFTGWMPVSAGLVAVLALGEPVSAAQLAGMGCVLAAIALGTRL